MMRLMALRKKASMALATLMPLVYLVAAAAIVGSLSTNGSYPSGAEALSQLYRGDVVYQSLRQGIVFPFYDPMWACGTALLRYVPPLASYVLAFCQAMAGGSIFNGYLLFTGLLFYGGALIWLGIGIKLERPLFGALMGLTWFFQPYALQVLFGQGNLALALAVTLLPWLLYLVFAQLRAPVWKRLPAIALFTLVLILCHGGLGAMALVGLGLMMGIRALLLHSGRGLGSLALSLLSGLLLASLWLLPCLSGGLGKFLTGSLTETTAPLTETLNAAAAHMGTGQEGMIYFGLALFLLLCLGGFLAPRDSAAGAFAGLLLVLMSTNAFGQFLEGIFGRYLPLLLGLPVAAALGWLCFLGWNRLRRPLAVLLGLLVLADTLPAVAGFAGHNQGETALTAEARMAELAETTLLDRAQELTTHRLAILDGGSLGDGAAFLAAAWGNGVPTSRGGAGCFSPAEDKQAQIELALVTGHYEYVFDRCLEMGCDTVLLRTALVPAADQAKGTLDAAAKRLGFTLAESTGPYSVYHAELGAGWGLVSDYSAIGIGETVGNSALAYPVIREMADPNLNHYSLEELQAYSLVLLSGFSYDNQEAAEALVLALSEAGVRVVIEADGIPADKSGVKRFLGVSCQEISFSGGYPALELREEKTLHTELFPTDEAKWETQCLSGLNQVKGTVEYSGVAWAFYGTARNENLIFLGLDLPRFYALTGDGGVGELLDGIFGLPGSLLPQRRVVPLGLTYGSNSLAFTAEEAVNTTLLRQDFMQTDRETETRSGFLEVEAGETVVRLGYPRFAQGLLLSIAGLILLAVLTLERRYRAGVAEKAARRRTERAQAQAEEMEGENHEK